MNTFVVHAKIEKDDEGYRVNSIWTAPAVDRPHTHGYGLRTLKEAERLKRAIDAGVVYANPRVATDNGGRTYVAADKCVMGKYLNADLKKLGF